jgi:hypothetical protein
MKAIAITKANQDMLVSRFSVDPIDKDRELPIGMWLVTDFGNDEYFDVVTQVVFDQHFTKGDAIDNGFIVILRRFG